jgi:hypothetical protein
MSLKDDALEIALVAIGVGALVWYVEAKYQKAGGAAGVVSSVFGWAADGLSNAGGAVLDAMPSSQVPVVVDTVQAGLAPGQVAPSAVYQYESALMGGGS